jgi:hypothetical protein
MAGSFVMSPEFLVGDQEFAAKIRSEGRAFPVPVPHYRLGKISPGTSRPVSVDTLLILFVAGTCIFRHFVADICNLGFDGNP